MPQNALPSTSGVTPVGTSLSGGTIVSGGTFQIALGPNPKRKGGFLQNNSAANIMYIFAGISGTARGSSVEVPVGSFFNLNMGTPGFVYTGTIWVDGTTGDAFSVTELM
jgi:hypothetical protein